jgi:hypothetical protein
LEEFSLFEGSFRNQKELAVKSEERPIAGRTALEEIGRLPGNANAIGTTEVVVLVENSAQGKSTMELPVVLTGKLSVTNG